MNLSENLKKIRKDNNLSQEQLAEKLGVSRQSVSKWESNQAYPEMDKMLQLCQIFNINIDELLNQDIKEVNNTKQTKNNINKFIDSFFDYITKTINLFCSIKLKDKIKCIIEQIIIISILILVYLVIGTILENILRGLINFLSENMYYTLISISKSIYLIMCLILGIIIILHIFKIRYLDYYVIVKNNDEEEDKMNSTEIKKEESKIIKLDSTIINEKREKIIIRDPKHSEYKFITSLLNFFIILIKIIISLIEIMFCISLVILIILTILSFLFIQTGILFIGTILTLLSLIIINLIILILLFNFIISKKTKVCKMAISFILSLFIMGIGIGMIFIGLSKFNVIDNINNNNFITEEYTIEMTNDLFIDDYFNNIEFIENNNNDIKIVYTHSKYNNIELKKNIIDNYIYFNTYLEYDKIDLITYIKDINNKQILDYSLYEISIYTTKDNILKLKNNLKKYYNRQNEIDYQNTINNYEYRIRELEEEILEKDSMINDLKEQLNN